CNGNGAIIANSQGNIITALEKLGVRLRYDAFAERALIEGPEAAPCRHFDDAEAEALYLLIDACFGFKPGTDFFFMLCRTEARKYAFHPVRDYLDGLKWDGVARLDRWLVEYGGADDTEYTRAVGALMLIASVRRIRQPGCKFDEMPVWESEQGLEKST